MVDVDSPSVRRFANSALARVVVGTVLFLLFINFVPGGLRASRAGDQLGQLLAALLAASACGYRGWKDRDHRWPWLLLGGSAGSWAIGQAIWCYLELIKNVNPFPSLAIPFFMLLAPLCISAVLLFSSTQLSDTRRWRTLLDGLLVTGSMFILSWSTALGQAFNGQGESRFAYILSLYFPVSDLILITVAVLVASRVSARTGSTVRYIAAAMACLAISDSGYAYLSALGRFTGVNPVDAGWCAAFFILTAAAFRSSTAGPPLDSDAFSLDVSLPDDTLVESRAGALLPYGPAVIAFIVAGTGQVIDHGHQAVSLTAAALVVMALLTRQLLAVLDHHSLVKELLSAQDQLQRQAYHDPLTGLANRALFRDRLDHNLRLHEKNQGPLSLVYCDLDNFKPINDHLGHDAGDIVLKSVAECLRGATRSTHTVARLGGDEFAVLLDSPDPSAVIARIFAALARPTQIDTHKVFINMSIGVATLGTGETSVTGTELIHRADTAMYQAKKAGRNQCVTWASPLVSESSI